MENNIKTDRELKPLSKIIKERTEIIDPCENENETYKLLSVSQD